MANPERQKRPIKWETGYFVDGKPEGMVVQLVAGGELVGFQTIEGEPVEIGTPVKQGVYCLIPIIR